MRQENRVMEGRKLLEIYEILYNRCKALGSSDMTDSQPGSN